MKCCREAPLRSHIKRAYITLKRVNTVSVSDTENEVIKLNANLFFPYENKQLNQNVINEFQRIKNYLRQFQCNF